MARVGDWMETFTGNKFWPLDPRQEEVFIEDIAHALSMICRFGGHCIKFYSVAQHSCLVAELVETIEPKLAFAALLHDAAEAYSGDVIRPIKRSNPEIGKAELAIETVIAAKYGLAVPMPALIKWADNVLLHNEHLQLMSGNNEWLSCDQENGPVINITELTPGEAELHFLNRFYRYKL